ncbi:MAG: DUF423 domain-containing protein [Thiotrichales bacterium]
MARNSRVNWIVIAAINAALTVALGAFAAHGLKGQLDPGSLAVFETGARYHFYHALGLLGLGIALKAEVVHAHANLAAILLQSGIVLFSGSLYLLALTGIHWLGIITPFGGLAFIAGWITLAIAALR